MCLTLLHHSPPDHAASEKPEGPIGSDLQGLWEHRIVAENNEAIERNLPPPHIIPPGMKNGDDNHVYWLHHMPKCLNMEMSAIGLRGVQAVGEMKETLEGRAIVKAQYESCSLTKKIKYRGTAEAVTYRRLW